MSGTRHWRKLLVSENCFSWTSEIRPGIGGWSVNRMSPALRNCPGIVTSCKINRPQLICMIIYVKRLNYRKSQVDFPCTNLKNYRISSNMAQIKTLWCWIINVQYFLYHIYLSIAALNILTCQGNLIGKKKIMTLASDFKIVTCDGNITKGSFYTVGFHWHSDRFGVNELTSKGGLTCWITAV